MQPPVPTVSPPPTSYEPLQIGGDVAAFYQGRGFKPLWVAGGRLRPEAMGLVNTLKKAPGQQDIAALEEAVAAAAGGDRTALARADLLLSSAYAQFITDARRPRPAQGIFFVDEELEPQAPEPRAVLDAVATASDLRRHLHDARHHNPLHAALAAQLEVYRYRWSRLPRIDIPAGAPVVNPGDARIPLLRRRLGLAGEGGDEALQSRIRAFQQAHGLAPSGVADLATLAALNLGSAAFEQRIRLNMDRAAQLPFDKGRRHVIVDTASARLWMVEDGRIVDSMRVIVGKQGMETPVMAGLIRFAALNPYWELPQDLTRERARRVLRSGVGTLRDERMEVLTSWDGSARPLNPARVNWQAVASGRQIVRMRQVPGAHNMMGRVKFMLPNRLGIYLHDTPSKQYFNLADRRISSGCVRVEDAERLGRWLFGGRMPAPDGTPEQRVDLPEPVPVYITYFTALPGRRGIVFQPDRYGRDT